MKFLRRYWRESVLITLVVFNLSVWVKTSANKETDILKVYFLDVGQGDAIFIESPTGGRVLVDGGPNRKVLSELGNVLPFGDKRIDVVIETHPDADHIVGLVDVLKRYKVGAFISSGNKSLNDVDEILAEVLSNDGIRQVIGKRGLTMSLGKGATLTILYPSEDLQGSETNDASIVSKLVYGETSFMLTGDSTKRAEYALLGMNEEILDVDVLQAGHHGSKTSTSPLYAEAASPLFAVVSAGKDNRYGHPHDITIQTLSKVGAEILSTAYNGTIKFETDGEKLFLK
ncbi:MAG: ComEC/Rec2 family competence protein [Minisyncoccota bacterium]